MKIIEMAVFKKLFGGGGGDGSPYVVNIPVTISASVSVTAEDQ